VIGFDEPLNAAANHIFVLEDASAAGADRHSVDSVTHQRHIVLDNPGQVLLF
jgi:hypothetical protein